MNLTRISTLLNRLKIKHRDRPADMVPFLLNPNQRRMMAMLEDQYDQTGMLRAIVLKARRVGISSLTEGLLFSHCLAHENAHNKIVAHLASTSEDLFRVPRDFAFSMPHFRGDIQNKRIFFDHTGGRSRLDIATAGTPSAGRGATLSALHLSEAAQFPGEDSFLSLLPAVSRGPDTIIIIESTAYGKEGPGEAFYDFWNQAYAERSDFIAIFLPWLDDPACVRDPKEAADAPATDLERELMSKPFHASKSQIAWMRAVLESDCRGLENKWLQEYPHSPDVAFISTGDPAFQPDELRWVRTTLKLPPVRGTLHRLPTGGFTFTENRQGMLHLWQMPVRDDGIPRTDRYYIGADAALGREEGDFAAYCILNGTTGELVARFADRIHPEALADQLDMAGRWFGNAKINIELTGHYGREAQKIMRDRYHYPNFHIWKGKDDRQPGKGKSVVMGWETTAYSRRQLFDYFRIKLREGLRHEPQGLHIYDHVLLQQMENATLYEGFNWEVRHGHDDVLFAAMLAVASCFQHPPPTVTGWNKKPATDMSAAIMPTATPDTAYELQTQWRETFGDPYKKVGHLLPR